MNNNPILYHKHHPPALEIDEDLDDDELFRRVMADVTPLEESTNGGGNGKKTVERKRARDLAEDIVLPRDVLEDFIRSQSRDEFTKDDMQGGAETWNQPLLRRLREGDFSVQAELDLHGLSRKEAGEEVRTFIEECSRRRLTCVRIIHGQGRNSRNRVPVLKRYIPLWLSHKRMSRYVVAYTSARRVDGGAGAIYVLLRPKQ